MLAKTSQELPEGVTANSGTRELRASNRANAIRSILQARIDRHAFFPDGLFSDPAWDILLALYEAKLLQKSLTLADACVGSDASPAAASRWVDALEYYKLIERVRDPEDERRTLLSLSDKGQRSFDAYFESIRHSFPIWTDA